MCVCRARDTYVKDRLARSVLRLEGVVFRPKVSRALRESSVAGPRRPADEFPFVLYLDTLESAIGRTSG